MNLTEKRKIEKLVTAKAEALKTKLLEEARASYKEPGEETPGPKAKQLQKRLSKENAAANRGSERVNKTQELLKELGWEARNGRRNVFSYDENVQLFRIETPGWAYRGLESGYGRNFNKPPTEGDLRKSAKQFEQYPTLVTVYTELADKFAAIDVFTSETIVLELYLSEDVGIETFEALIKKMNELVA